MVESEVVVGNKKTLNEVLYPGPKDQSSAYQVLSSPRDLLKKSGNETEARKEVRFQREIASPVNAQSPLLKPSPYISLEPLSQEEEQEAFGKSEPHKSMMGDSEMTYNPT